MINLINIILCALTVLIAIIILGLAVTTLQVFVHNYTQERYKHKKYIKYIDNILGKNDE